MVRKVRFELTTPRIQGEYATIASLPDNGSRSENRTHLVHVMSVPSSPELYPDMYERQGGTRTPDSIVQTFGFLVYDFGLSVLGDIYGRTYSFSSSPACLCMVPQTGIEPVRFQGYGF